MFPLPVILLDPTKNSLLFGGPNAKNISKCCHGKKKPQRNASGQQWPEIVFSLLEPTREFNEMSLFQLKPLHLGSHPNKDASMNKTCSRVNSLRVAAI